MLVQAVLEIGCRLMLYRSRFFRSFPWNPVIALIVILFQLGLVAAGTVMVTGLARDVFEIRVSVPHSLGKMKLLFDGDLLLINLPLLYLLARIGTFVIYNTYLWLCFTPLIEGSAKTPFSLWRAIHRKVRNDLFRFLT